MPGPLHPRSHDQQTAFAVQTAEIRSTLRDAAEFAHEQGNAREWKPAASSPAWLDLADDMWQPRKNRPHSPMHWGYTTCQLRILASADYLDALADLVARWPPSPYAPTVLARATVESSARVAWLLDHDLNRQLRASRMLADRLSEELQRYNVDPNIGRPRVLEVTEVAGAYGIELNVAENGWPKSVIGVKYPKLREVVPHVLPDGDDSLAVWKSYANLSHGSPFSVLSSIAISPDDDSDDYVGTIRISMHGIASVAGTALYSFLHVLNLYGSRYGWNRSARWERESERLIHRLKNFLRRHTAGFPPTAM